MRTVGDWMTAGVMWLFFDLGFIGGAIYGVVYPLLVITGMHHCLVTAETQILASQGPAGLYGVIVIRPESMVQYMVTMVITFVTATIATILLSTVFQKKENSTN